MANIVHDKLRQIICSCLHHFWVVLAIAGFAFGQTSQRQPSAPPASDKPRLSAAIARLNAGEFESYDIELIRQASATEAIPALEKQFDRIQIATKLPTNPDDLSRLLDKAKIASVLVKLGDKDNAYWDFLVRLAAPALASDAPGFMAFDAQGKAAAGPSPEFVAWARAHNISPDDGHAAEEQLYILPSLVAFLGLTEDTRAVPLLRRALVSPNWMIQIMGAKGLSELQDKESIPLMLEACKRAPADVASQIAESLVYFDDPEAQNAVDKYVSRDAAKALRDAKALGKKKPFD